MLTVLTVTKDRPLGIKLLAHWLDKQTFKDFRWLIVTDGATDGFPELPANAVVLKRTGDHYRDKGKIVSGEVTYHSMLNNYIAGLKYAKDCDIAVCEDDEWFASNYLEKVVSGLGSAELVGFVPSYYFHFPSLTYKILHNASFATLTASSWRATLTPTVLDLCRQGSVSVDLELWNLPIASKRIERNDKLNLSVKGLPGSAGIGQYHRAEQFYGVTGWGKLEEFIGQDCKLYQQVK